jgi:NADPH:quinone reductase-like Zn-dependent oxidoreductase
MGGPADMRAIVQDRYGGPERWRPATVPRPVPGEGEVLVAVRAAGIDRGTWHLMTGLPYLARPSLGLRGPRVRIPGRDVAGVVARTGPGVDDLRPGDEVVGMCSGTFAEYALAPRDRLVRRPAGLAWEAAAVLGISGVTALQAVVDAGRIAPGQRVLVIGASGGVGTYAVQIARAFGGEVTGMCSADKADLVAGLGAVRCLDYAREDVTAGGPYDLIIDIAGRRPVARLRDALAPRGTLVVVGGEGGGRWTGGFGRGFRAALRSPLTRQRLTVLVSRERGQDLERLAALAAAGSVVPVLDRTFALDHARDAMRRLESGRARGKIALTV